jgi:hypothetical protein
MKVKKTTPEEELKEKEAYFLKLSAEARLRMMREVNDRTRKRYLNYELRNKRVMVIRKGEHLQ